MRFAAPLAVLATIAIPSAFAGTIPYGNIGHVAPTSIVTATNTGNVMAYFYGSSAADTDYIRMVDLTSNMTSAWVFNNQTTKAGTSANLGKVTAGDILLFELQNQTDNNAIFASNPSFSADCINHAYMTAFSGDSSVNVPAGTYVGMEDLPKGSSDLDYNDDQYVFTNVAFTQTPEPSSIALLGTGVLSAAGVMRRRLLGR